MTFTTRSQPTIFKNDDFQNQITANHSWKIPGSQPDHNQPFLITNLQSTKQHTQPKNTTQPDQKPTIFRKCHFHNQITTNHSWLQNDKVRSNKPNRRTLHNQINNKHFQKMPRSQPTILDNKMTKYEAINPTEEHHTTRSKPTISDNRRNITTYTNKEHESYYS